MQSIYRRSYRRYKSTQKTSKFVFFLSLDLTWPAWAQCLSFLLVSSIFQPVGKNTSPPSHLGPPATNRKKGPKSLFFISWVENGKPVAAPKLEAIFPGPEPLEVSTPSPALFPILIQFLSESPPSHAIPLKQGDSDREIKGPKKASTRLFGLTDRLSKPELSNFGPIFVLTLRRSCLTSEGLNKPFDRHRNCIACIL